MRVPQVKLRPSEVEKLRKMCGGSTPGREVKRAQILRHLNEGHGVEHTAKLVLCGSATVKRIRARFLDEGLDGAIKDKPRPGRKRTTTDKDEQELIAVACTSPPKGAARWTIRLLAKHTKRTYAFVQRVLKEDGLKPWREKNVVRGKHRH